MVEYTPLPDIPTIEALQEFQQEHDEKFHPHVHALDDLRALPHHLHHLVKITGLIARLCDKRDHGEIADADTLLQELITKGLPDLFAFTLILANMHNIDLTKAYFERIREIEDRDIRQ